jgi:predicted NAD/FAD-dependent oxidoreductase
MRPAIAVALVARDGGAPPARRIVVSDPARALCALQLPGSGGQGRTSEPLVAVASGAFAKESTDLADDVVVRRLCAEAERFAPRYVREIQSARVVRWEAGLPCFGIGAYRALARVRRVEAWQLESGRQLVLAGDHLVGPRLEDAIASGVRAADMLAGAAV